MVSRNNKDSILKKCTLWAATSYIDSSHTLKRNKEPYLKSTQRNIWENMGEYGSGKILFSHFL